MSKELPLISVCVINYNNAVYLYDCVGSVLEQTYPNIEIVFCDDASTDDSREVFENIIKKSSRKIKVNRQYRSKNGGLGGAPNCYTGATHFRGSYVCFLDADDFLHPDHVKILYKLITRYKTDISATNHQEFHNDTPPKITSLSHRYNARVLNTHENIDQFYFQSAPVIIPFSKWHRLYAKKVFRDIKNVPESYFGNSDSAYSIYTFINSKTLVQVDNVATYYYRILETSDSHASWYQLLKNRTYDSVTKLSKHYIDKLPKIDKLSAARNNQVVVMMFDALVKEKLPYREYKHTWRLAKQNNFSFIREQVFGKIPDDNYKKRALRKSFFYAPLGFYLWKKRRSV